MLNRCAGFFSAIPSFVKKSYFALRPFVSAGWIISPMQLFCAWALNTPEDENVLNNPWVATTTGLAVLAIFTINFMGKYPNMVRETPPNDKKDDPQLNLRSWHYIPYAIALINNSIFYPGYILFNGTLCIYGFYSLLFDRTLASTSFWKQFGLIAGGLFFSFPSVVSNYRYTRVRTKSYIPDLVNGTYLNCAGVASGIITTTGVVLGYELSYSSIANTAKVFSQNSWFVGSISNIFSTSIAINNFIMTIPALTRLLNGTTFSDLPDYKMVAPCYSHCKAPLFIFSMTDGALNGLGTFTAVAKKYFNENSPAQLSRAGGAISTLGLVTILLSVAATDRETIYTELQTRIALNRIREEQLLLPEENPPPTDHKIEKVTSSKQTVTHSNTLFSPKSTALPSSKESVPSVNVLPPTPIQKSDANLPAKEKSPVARDSASLLDNSNAAPKHRCCSCVIL